MIRPISTSSRLLARCCCSVLCLSLVACNLSTNPVGPRKLTAAPEDAIERTTSKGPIELTMRLWPPAPRLSDLVQLEVEVRAEASVEVKPPTFGQAVGDFLVRDYSETTSQLDKATPSSASNAAVGEVERTQPTTRCFRYQLEPVHAGRHLIRSIALEFIDRRPNSENGGHVARIESEPLEVEVTSELGDKEPDLAELEPMLAPQPLTQDGRWWWLLLTVPIIAAVAVWYWRRHQQIVAPPALPQKSPQEVAQEALTALLAENLPAQSRFQEFYLRLTGIVRHYIEGVTGVRAPELTTEEFLRTMRRRELFGVEHSLRLQEFLEAADMVKFAGQQPDEEQIELATRRAQEFIQLRSLFHSVTATKVEV